MSDDPPPLLGYRDLDDGQKRHDELMELLEAIQDEQARVAGMLTLLTAGMLGGLTGGLLVLIGLAIRKLIQAG